MTPPDENHRQRYIDGLRVIATALEQDETLPLPLSKRMVFLFQGDGARENMAAAARLLPTRWDKQVSGQGSQFFDLAGRVAGLEVELSAPRKLVCERVVTGTTVQDVEEIVTPAVTRMVPTKVDVVEWRCSPLLAPDGPHDSAAETTAILADPEAMAAIVEATAETGPVPPELAQAAEDAWDKATS